MIVTLGLSVVLIGCSGDSSSDVAKEEASASAQTVNVSDALLKKSWVFRMADDANRASFEGDAGWTAYFNRSYEEASTSLQGAGLARIHAEIASVYRQAVLVHANATKHNYETDRQEEDSVDSLYLRGVSKIFLNDFDGAQADFAKLDDEKLKGYAAQWVAFAKASETERPKIEPHFLNLPKRLDAGVPFRPESVPHFDIRTSFEGTSASVTDATELWVRSVWHEELAKSLVSDPRLIDLWISPWRLPFESQQPLSQEKLPTLDDSWAFLSPYLVPEDLFFVHDLQAVGVSALSTWDEKSILAGILQDCMITEGGKEQLQVSKVLNAASTLEEKLNQEMKASTGKEQPFYPLFADFAEQAVLRAGVLVADANAQYRDAGKLRINANDLALINSQDPVFLISFAAWDVGNRYPLRAQKTLHRYESDFPALKVAGHPLGTLQIRLGKSAASGAAN